MSAQDALDADLYDLGASLNPTNAPNIAAGAHQVNPPTTIDKVSTRESSVTKIPEPLTKENWNDWKSRMNPIFNLCDIEGYIDGQIPCPANSTQAKNWHFNDNYSKLIIMNNITSLQMIHIGECKTAHLMWASLQAVHEARGHLTIMSIMHNLFHTIAGDNTNIIEHLTQMKVYWERLNVIGVDEIRLSDFIFKILISSSLPPSWDMFTETYVGGILGIKDTSPKKTLHSQHFIGILKEEYTRRENRKNCDEVTNVVTNNNSLANRMSHPKAPRQQSNATCGQCGKKGHETQNCIYLGKSKCTKCNKFHAAQECWKCDTCNKYGHRTKDCWKNGKNKRKRSNQSSSGGSTNKFKSKSQPA
jgi:hypothetical protein